MQLLLPLPTAAAARQTAAEAVSRQQLLLPAPLKICWPIIGFGTLLQHALHSLADQEKTGVQFLQILRTSVQLRGSALASYMLQLQLQPRQARVRRHSCLLLGTKAGE